MIKSLFASALLALPLAAHAATGEVRSTAAAGGPIPAQLDEEQRTGYRTVFASIRDGKWADAQLQLAAMKPGPLHAIARAELYTAKGSPKVAVENLVALLAEAPELPQAEQLVRMARARGATALPELPEAQRLTWTAGASVRSRAKSARSDLAAADLATRMTPLIKEDRAADAQALLDSRAAELTPEALTEWQQRVAWIYYLTGDDARTRELAARAQAGTGEWAVHADWTQALAAWRQKDCAAAGAAFERVASRAGDVELRAAGLYWASRADMACGRPDRIEARLRQAGQYDETFYGLLARQALGMKEAPPRNPLTTVNADWNQLSSRPNVRVARALTEIDEAGLADEVIRQQAKIGDVAEYAALVRLTERLSLASTQVWLSNNCPPSVTPPAEARYPAPEWVPDGGWKVDRSLVYAHALQESRFRAEVASPAGAFGLMQIMPAAATDYARRTGVPIDRRALARPSTNIAVGQSHLQALRDLGATGGLLPKVIAAYNAGPAPVQLWNAMARDGGDPLLYIESIPYWETRGYVVTVLRNYWMYERRAGEAAPSRAALAQGMWPKFPGQPGAAAVRLVTPRAPVYLAPAAPVMVAVAERSVVPTPVAVDAGGLPSAPLRTDSLTIAALATAGRTGETKPAFLRAGATAGSLPRTASRTPIVASAATGGRVAEAKPVALRATAATGLPGAPLKTASRAASTADGPKNGPLKTASRPATKVAVASAGRTAETRPAVVRAGSTFSSLGPARGVKDAD